MVFVGTGNWYMGVFVGTYESIWVVIWGYVRVSVVTVVPHGAGN
jgi:hypothetical protein